MAEVVPVRWPIEVERRTRLTHARIPRLLLIEDESPPPVPEDCLEDWVRVPASDAEVRSRMSGLSLRAANHIVDRPGLDIDGLLRFGDDWVSLPPVEARLAGPLIERFGAVVGRETLSRAGWPNGAPGRNALDVHVLRLRRRLTTVGLGIRTVRSRGYLLEASVNRRSCSQEA